MHPDELTHEVRVYNQLKEQLKAAFDLEDDDQTLLDTLEGESDLETVIIRAMREAREAKAMADAMKIIIATNRARQKRHEDRAERIRGAVAHAMEESNKRSIKCPDMTISERMSEAAPKVTDPAQLPKWATTEESVVVTSVNLAAIKAAYEADPAGFTCPGVAISDPKPILTVRAK